MEDNKICFFKLIFNERRTYEKKIIKHIWVKKYLDYDSYIDWSSFAFGKKYANSNTIEFTINGSKGTFWKVIIIIFFFSYSIKLFKKKKNSK